MGMTDQATGPDITISEAAIGAGAVTVVWSDRMRHNFHPLWLRERGESPDKRDPGTGLRVTQAAFLPLDIQVTAAEPDRDGGLSLRFSDGHACRYEARDLLDSVPQPWPDDLVGEKARWDGAVTDLPKATCCQVLDDERAVLDLLDGLACGGQEVQQRAPGDGR